MEHIVSILKETYRNIERNLDRKWFKNLWENNGNIYDFYELAKDVYYKTFKKELSFEDWDKAWQYRTILHENYKVALNEFINALMGFY